MGLVGPWYSHPIASYGLPFFGRTLPRLSIMINKVVEKTGST